MTNLRLPGQYDERLLGSLGLQGPYYNWNRWYLPGVGRYLELDPLALNGGRNSGFAPDWYTYAGQNPVRFVDPTGLTCESNWNFFWDWAIAGGAASRTYGGGSTETGEMKDSSGAGGLRDYFYKVGCRNVSNWCYGTRRAYFDTVASPCSTAFQVGGFCGDAIRDGDTVTFRIRNEAGRNSFFYHVVPNRSGTTGPGRTITQIFEWTESVDACRCGK